MTEKEAQALALLVNGTAVGAKVYLRQPERISNNCTGCAFSGPDGPLKALPVCNVLQANGGCVGHIWQELKT